MNILTQEAKKKEQIIKYSEKHSVAKASRMYGVARSNIYRWKKRYSGTWQSLLEHSHRPHHHPHQHTKKEEQMIRDCFQSYERYGFEGVYSDLLKRGYKRSIYGMIHAAKRMGLHESKKHKKSRLSRRYPELLVPGEKVQIDVKVVPYYCLRGEALQNNRHFYQWTAIDECTRYRFVYAFEEHTPVNTVIFIEMLLKAFPFRIQTIQTDNGTEFTNKYISDDVLSPVDVYLNSLGINHKLVPPRTPWHNGKVERSHRLDQRTFYEWEKFRSCEDLNRKLAKHLEYTNNKKMRTLGWLSPFESLCEKIYCTSLAM